MKLIVPNAVTDATLTTTNMTEADYSVWVDANYSVGDYVISTATHRIYRALTVQTLGTPQDPDIEAADIADPFTAAPATIYWQIISATNIWQLFDEKPSHQCENATSIYVKITPAEIIGGIALFRVEGTEVTIKMTDPTDGVVYDETIDMQDDSGIVDWYTWAYSPIIQVTEMAVTDLPPYKDAYIEITITKTGGTAKCGQVVLGPVFAMGNLLTEGSGWSTLDYSYVANDDYGNRTTVVRSATRLSNFEIEVNTTLNLSLDSKLRELRGGKPSVWVGSTDARKAATAYGIILNARSYYQDGNVSRFSITLQGLV